MFTLTENAAGQLQEILAGSLTPDGYGVRLVDEDVDGIIGMAISRPGKNDLVVGSQENPLLIVAPDLVGHLDGAVIDLARDGRDAPRFVIRHEAV
jgi:Fe-S cluster assembly iron-binding protein IscA